MTEFFFSGQCAILASCGPEEIIPSSCPADINRDRDVGVGDMLDMFGQWGPCPE